MAGAAHRCGGCVWRLASIPLLLRDFDSLEALFIAVFDRLVLEAARDALRAIEAAGPGPGAGAVAYRRLHSLRHGRPVGARMLFVEALGDETVGRRRLDTLHTTADFLERSAAPTGLADDPIGWWRHTWWSRARRAVVTWLDGRLPITLDQLVEDGQR